MAQWEFLSQICLGAMMGVHHLVPCGMEVHCERMRSGWGKIPVAGEKQGRDSPILRLASVDVTPEAAAAIL